MFDSHYLTFIRMQIHFIIKCPRVKDIYIPFYNCVIPSSFFIYRHIFVSSAYKAMCISVLMPWQGWSQGDREGVMTPGEKFVHSMENSSHTRTVNISIPFHSGTTKA